MGRSTQILGQVQFTHIRCPCIQVCLQFKLFLYLGHIEINCRKFIGNIFLCSELHALKSETCSTNTTKTESHTLSIIYLIQAECLGKKIQVPRHIKRSIRLVSHRIRSIFSDSKKLFEVF